jgi:hypothetical protein|tara:strand:+ start:321 stop:515 length:195 start_codon:yes stop_codon:yes gene_type:complete
MTNKEMELKLEIIYEQTMRLDLLNYLEWKDSADHLLEIIQKDILDLRNHCINKTDTTNVVRIKK